MSEYCRKKETCGKCGGEGRITVYTTNDLSKVAALFGETNYVRETKRVTCDECHGNGKVHAYHDYHYVRTVEKRISGYFSPSYFVEIHRCSYCGDQIEQQCPY